jgi:hypothetical protein
VLGKSLALPEKGRARQQRAAPKSKAPGGFVSSGRKVDLYPLGTSFFRNLGKGQAIFFEGVDF